MYLVQGQANTPHLLAFFTVDPDGWLYDPHSIRFRVFGPDGVQVFPTVPDTWETITGYEYDSGHYYAYDTEAGDGWAPSADATPGRYTIEWGWTPEAGDTERTARRTFYVESSDDYEGVGWVTYLAPAQVRAEGITADDLSASRLESLIADAQDYIENTTQNVFRPIPQDFTVNGSHSAALFLGLPIIGVRGIYANGSNYSLSSASVYVSHARVDESHRYRANPDPRRNPVVRLRGSNGGGQFNWPETFEVSRFRAGAGNQRIDGVFGFLERDGSVPRQIQEAMLRLIVANAEPLEVGSEPVAGPVASRTTDRNSITYAVSGAETSLGWAGATSKRIEEILVRYRRPIAVRSSTPGRVWG